MRTKLALALSATALLVAVLGATGPAVAQAVRTAVFAQNADKLDNRHGVGSAATVRSRKGKYVATSTATGRLPNDIIQKAPDANLLDGFDSTAFLAGGGTVIRDALAVPSNDLRTVETPFSEISYICPLNPLAQNGSVGYTNTSSGVAQVWIDNGTTVQFANVGAGSTSQTASLTGDHLTIAAVHGLEPDRTVVADVYSVHQDNITCTAYVNAVGG